jgi:4-hydroxy-tetrahydrodipicolinate synthase
MIEEKKYHGVVIPMVTPFTNTGEIDLRAAEKITEHIAVSGACPFALGTTGETASIRTSAKTEYVETVVKKTARRTLTYAGIIDNCITTSVEMAEQFFEAGIDVVVACVPSYYPLTVEDIINYFENLARQTSGLLMLYNIPITTGVSIPLEVLDKLSRLPGVIGLKDTVRDIDRIRQAAELWKDREDFSYLCGSTPLSVAALAAGADGIVPSVGNISPELFMTLYNSVRAGDMKQAKKCQSRSDTIGDIFQKNKILSESLPILKAILHVMGFCEPNVLPPLRRLETDCIEALRESVNKLGLLKE